MEMDCCCALIETRQFIFTGRPYPRTGTANEALFVAATAAPCMTDAAEPVKAAAAVEGAFEPVRAIAAESAPFSDT